MEVMDQWAIAKKAGRYVGVGGGGGRRRCRRCRRRSRHCCRRHCRRRRRQLRLQLLLPTIKRKNLGINSLKKIKRHISVQLHFH